MAVHCIVLGITNQIEHLKDWGKEAFGNLSKKVDILLLGARLSVLNFSETLTYFVFINYLHVKLTLQEYLIMLPNISHIDMTTHGPFS